MVLQKRLIIIQSSYFSTVRKGFGSFHSEDPEVLVKLSSNEYQEPPIRSKISTRLNLQILNELEFGDKAKKILFNFDHSWTFINHGAFGATARMLLHESSLWRNFCEEQPLRYFDRSLFPLLIHSIREMSKFLKCPPTELLPLQNVTAGMNSAVKSVNLESGDEIICFSFTYTKRLLQETATRTNSILKIIDIILPIQSKDIILDALKSQLTTKCKMIVIDHITSSTAMLIPVIDIALLCREIVPEITIIVDAAHSIFAYPISVYPCKNTSIIDTSRIPRNNQISNNLKENNANISDVVDIWMSNGHKWLCAPKGCAFMWINPHYTGLVQPVVVSHGFSRDSSRRLSGFIWDGCRDYSAMLTIPTALAMWSALPGGVDGCRKYMNALIRNAYQLLMIEWEIRESDIPCPLELRDDICMALVPLPDTVSGMTLSRHATDAEAFALQVILLGSPRNVIHSFVNVFTI